VDRHRGRDGGVDLRAGRRRDGDRRGARRLRAARRALARRATADPRGQLPGLVRRHAREPRGELVAARRTGASTNLLSKAAYELAPARRRRLAASAGYVCTELAKEIPYYAGAFGANVATDAVSANDALVFLAGANAGAALYEYGLARLTRAFLAR